MYSVALENAFQTMCLDQQFMSGQNWPIFREKECTCMHLDDVFIILNWQFILCNFQLQSHYNTLSFDPRLRNESASALEEIKEKLSEEREEAEARLEEEKADYLRKLRLQVLLHTLHTVHLQREMAISYWFVFDWLKLIYCSPQLSNDKEKEEKALREENAKTLEKLKDQIKTDLNKTESDLRSKVQAEMNELQEKLNKELVSERMRVKETLERELEEVRARKTVELDERKQEIETEHQKQLEQLQQLREKYEQVNYNIY